MGDRAIVQFHNESELGPGVYLHWQGSNVGELLKKTRELMLTRSGSVEYITARFIYFACANDSGSPLSIGVFNQKNEKNIKDFINHDEHNADSPGDAGYFLVNCTEWTVKYYDGYGFGGEEVDEGSELYIAEL
jgi:hypothetical protein